MPIQAGPWQGRKPFARPKFNATKANDLCAQLRGHYADFWRTGGSTTIISDRTFRIDRQGPNSSPRGMRLHIQQGGDSLAAILIDENLSGYAGNKDAQAAIEARVIEAFAGSVGNGAGGQAYYWRVSGQYP
ncbi:hypothetical protein [Nocardiopsis alba]|uniref:hypothetical protein n=1 Tax=Nocardiopsis alba TaxID=53437 RepID=UPI0005AAF7ED|nr:hypothetical protein [Nocardiopsis alba]